MTIAFITPEFVTEPNSFDGGLSNYVFRVSLSLIQLGHRPIVIVSSNVDEEFTHEGIEVFRVKIDPNSSKLLKLKKKFTENKINDALDWIFQSKVLNKKLKELSKEINIDIVQYASYTGTSYYKIKNKPAVARISSYEPMFIEGKKGEVGVGEQKRIETEQKAVKNVDAVFGPSTIVAERIKKELGINVEIIETPFTLDTKELDYSYYEEKLKGKKYLFFFGSIGTLKGVRTIADILEELLLQHTDLNFVFLGKDIDSVQYIKDKSTNVADRVIFFDKMPHSLLYPILENAFAAVLPSRVDNFPNTCIEAMAFGKVVIGTWGTSFEQLITDNENGFLIEIDNDRELLEACNKVLELPKEKLDAMGNLAKKRIERLAPEIVVNQLLEFYKKTISNFNK